MEQSERCEAILAGQYFMTEELKKLALHNQSTVIWTGIRNMLP